MNLPAIPGLGLASLFKYANLKSADLTPAIVGEIAKTLGMPGEVTDEKFQRVVAMLKDDNVDGMADLVSNKTLIAKLRELLGAPAADEDRNLFICAHCGEYNNPQ
jgi:hypothetical protein